MKGRKGGFGGSIVGWIISLVMIGFVLAALQLSGVTSVEDSLNVAKQKAAEYKECIPAGECGLSTIFADIPEIIKGNGGGMSLITNDTSTSSGGKPSGGGPSASGSDTGGSTSSENVGTIGKDERGYRGPGFGEPYVNNSGRIEKDVAKQKLETLSVVSDKEDDKKDVGYSRKEWKHWSSVGDRGCWNTRSEILHRDAVPGTVKYLDKKKKETSYETACVIGIVVEGKDGSISTETKGSGEWIDPYSGKKIKDPRDIDIDHVIPLSNAARQGGQAWTAEEKEKFANDPDNLLATSAKENRKKGEKGPGKYMPPLKSYHCQYAKTYVSLSDKYKLTITESDYKVLNEALDSCAK